MSPNRTESSEKVDRNDTSNSANVSYSEAMNLKRQETASAVAQMRERLKSMGILDNNSDNISKNPISGDNAVNNQSVLDNSKLPSYAIPPPLPPAFGLEGAESHSNNNPQQSLANEEDDDVASTVSGGSNLELEPSSNPKEMVWLLLVTYPTYLVY